MKMKSLYIHAFIHPYKRTYIVKHKYTANLELQCELQVLRWRVFSVISEIEFSALYKEYSARIDSALAAEHATTARKKKSSKAKSTTKLGSKERKGDKPDLTLTSSSQGAIWLARFREMLLIEAVSEPDLDLFVGLLLHEFNTLLVDQTISYRSNPNQLDTVDGIRRYFLKLFFILCISGEIFLNY